MISQQDIGVELRLPVVIVMLRRYDDDHGEDGAQHNGGDANRQTDEGEVARLTGGYFRRHHVPSGYRRTHLSDAGGKGGMRERGKIRKYVTQQADARVGAGESVKHREWIDFTAAQAECAVTPYNIIQSSDRWVRALSDQLSSHSAEQAQRKKSILSRCTDNGAVT